jgi:phage-related tail protein
MAWVGEQGPELVQFKGGERVFTASQSAALARSLVRMAPQAGSGVPSSHSETHDNRIDTVNVYGAQSLDQIERDLMAKRRRANASRSGWGGR